MQNVLEFIKFALSHADPNTIPKNAELPYPVGDQGVWEYLWGTRGQVVTQSLLNARWKSYYSKNGWTKTEYDAITYDWVKDGIHVTDCQGLLDAYLGNDTNANGNYNNYCTDKGPISSIDRPFVIGEAVFNGTNVKKTHVGWVCGFVGKDPLVVEARGLAYGVVITRMSKRSWKYRGLMTKRFTYDPQPKPEPTPPDKFIFRRNLKYGCSGDDVIELKKLLIDAGYSNGITVNTKSSKNFRSATRRCVKEYQRDSGLTVDGIAGSKTIRSLGGHYE